MAYKCTFCGKQFETIPPEAVQVGNLKGRSRVCLFPDGAVHNLVSTKLGNNGRKKKADEVKP